MWRVPSTITALSSDYNSYCHSNSSYATSLRPIRAYIYTVQYHYDMYKKGKHRKFNMFDDIFARITIIQASIAPRNRKQLYTCTCRTGCCCSRSHRTTISINKRRENRSSANIHQMIQLLYASQCDITSFISEELDTVNNYLHNCRFLNECFESTTHFNHIFCTARL